jgi:hypothetical protein
VYPQTNNNWANVGLSFFTSEIDLDERGWLDPWSRPIDKSKLPKYKKEIDSGRKYRSINVVVGSPKKEFLVQLNIYKKYEK